MRKLNMKNVRAKRQEIQGRKSGSMHKLEVNQWEWFFVMPPWSDKGDIWKEIWKHGFKGGNCPEAMGVRKCPLCAELKRRVAAGDEDFEKQFYLQPQAYVNAIKVGDVKKGDPNSIKVLRLSSRLFDDLIDFILEGDGTGEPVDISDPLGAWRIGIKKYETGGGSVRYKDMKFGKQPENISRFITEDFLRAGLTDLDTFKFALPASDKELRSVFADSNDFGGSAGDDFSDDPPVGNFNQGSTSNDFQDDDFSDDDTFGSGAGDDHPFGNPNLDDGFGDDDLDADLSLDEEDELLQPSVFEQISTDMQACQDMNGLRETWAAFQAAKADMTKEEIQGIVAIKEQKKAELKGGQAPKGRPQRRRRT